MPKIFLIKNRLLQQQQKLLETSKQAPEGSNDEGDERDEKPQPPRITPRSLFGARFFASLQKSPNPGPKRGESDHENDSDEPLSLVVHKGKNEKPNLT